MGKAGKRATAVIGDEVSAAVDSEISRWFDVVDTKCLASYIHDIHGVTVSEMDIVMRASELAGVVA